MELISVLMSTYNETESELSQSIESILHQTYRNIQFLIVNDNPANPTLAHTLSRYAASDSRIQIVENEQNLGLVASLNRGWKLAKGQYIARMDADDIALPHRLESESAGGGSKSAVPGRVAAGPGDQIFPGLHLPRPPGLCGPCAAEPIGNPSLGRLHRGFGPGTCNYFPLPG